MEIKELQERVDAWIREYGVRYFSELTNMACLTEEVGELARVMARKYGDQSFKEGEKCNLADEMADVLWVLTCLANQTGVDLTAAMEANFAKKPRATKSGTAAIRNSDGAHSHTSGAATRIKLPDRPAPLLPWNVPGTVQRVWCELSRGGQQLFVVGNPSGRNHSTMSMQIAPYFPRTP